MAPAIILWYDDAKCIVDELYYNSFPIVAVRMVHRLKNRLTHRYCMFCSMWRVLITCTSDTVS